MRRGAHVVSTRVMGVSMKPGQTQFTRIPWRAPSTRPSVSLEDAGFDAE
jgi:hypothetical protein